MSMMVSFVLSFFPRDVLDEILNLIESVSEDFPSYSLMTTLRLEKMRKVTKLDFKLFYLFLVHIKEKSFRLSCNNL